MAIARTMDSPYDATLMRTRGRRACPSMEIHFPLMPFAMPRSAASETLERPGIRPANAPLRTVEAMPPDHASTGITTAQLAYTDVAATPGQHADDSQASAESRSPSRDPAHCARALDTTPR
jgi:hypothetical protein